MERKIQRVVNKVENSVAFIGLNFMLSFELKDLKLEDLKEAIRLAKLRYGYFRLKIIRDEETQSLIFIEQESGDELNKILLDFYELDNVEVFQNWTERFLKFGSKDHKLSDGVSHFELYSCKDQHQLLCSINHAGIDARGCFMVLKYILGSLDSILSGSQIDTPESKPFLNVHETFEHLYDINSLKSESVIQDEFHLNLNTIKSEENVKEEFSQNTSYSCYYQFDEEQTKSLLKNCRANKTTIQGVISLAVTIALINEKIDLTTIDSGYVECLNSVPCDMRYYFGLEYDDLIKGAASLCWMQKVDNGNLWKMASEATEKMRELKQSNDGLKWWTKINNGIKRHDYVVVSSSIGVISLNEDNLKNIKINDVRFFGSGPYSELNSDDDPRFLVVHAFTFANRLTINSSFSFPSFDTKWGKNYFYNVVAILIQLSKCKSAKLDLNEIVPFLKKF